MFVCIYIYIYMYASEEANLGLSSPWPSALGSQARTSHGNRRCVLNRSPLGPVEISCIEEQTPQASISFAVWVRDRRCVRWKDTQRPEVPDLTALLLHTGGAIKQINPAHAFFNICTLQDFGLAGLLTLEGVVRGLRHRKHMDGRKRSQWR